MSNETFIRQEDIDIVRSELKKYDNNLIKKRLMMQDITRQTDLMVIWRVLRSRGINKFPQDPDSQEEKSLVYNQTACFLFQGKIINGDSIWETHREISEREEILDIEQLMTGERFYMHNTPLVPIIILSAHSNTAEIDIYKKQCVLLDYEMNIL
jgi:hypothetical protein